MSPPAKMTLSRALDHLASAMAKQESRTVELKAAPRLDDAVNEFVTRGHPGLPEGRLQGLVLSVAVMHQSLLPPELPGRVAARVACPTRVAKSGAIAGEGAVPPRGDLAAWV